jgi:hypothetical protein
MLERFGSRFRVQTSELCVALERPFDRRCDDAVFLDVGRTSGHAL